MAKYKLMKPGSGNMLNIKPQKPPRGIKPWGDGTNKTTNKTKGFYYTNQDILNFGGYDYDFNETECQEFEVIFGKYVSKFISKQIIIVF